jgi:uncharacterized membrane protein
MQGKANLLGHSIHPMLVAFPLGLLSLVPVFDVVHLSSPKGPWHDVAFWMLTCGLVGALLAAVPGFIDWLSIPRGTRAYRVGLIHMGVNLSAVTLFAISWVLRFERGASAVGAREFLLGLAGFAIMIVGGWFGGELVQRLGMAVHDDASLNASSSLDAERLKLRHPSEPQLT